jgi:hypothetical protein
MKMPNFDGQTMAILVVWGADTECEPFRAQRQQLEPSILLAQKNLYLHGTSLIALEGVIDAHGLLRQKSKLCPRTHNMIGVIMIVS